MKNQRIAIYFLIVTCFSFMSCSAWSWILVRPQNVSETSFGTYLQHDNSHTSWLDHQISHRQDPQIFDKMLSDFERAQIYLLEKNYHNAKTHFLNIFEARHANDWLESSVNLIHYSILRLAEMETNSVQKRYYMQEAIAFAPELIPDVKHFSSDFILEFHTALSQMRSQVKIWKPYDSSLPQNAKISLNGKLFHVTKTLSLRLFSIPQKITIYTDYAPAFVTLGEAQKILEQQFQLAAFAEGSCTMPLVHHLPHSQITELAVWYSSECLYQPGKVAQSSLQQEESATIQWPAIPNATESQRASSSSFLKNKWIWGVLIGVAGAFVYDHNNVVIVKKTIRSTPDQ